MCEFNYNAKSFGRAWEFYTSVTIRFHINSKSLATWHKCVWGRFWYISSSRDPCCVRLGVSLMCWMQRCTLQGDFEGTINYETFSSTGDLIFYSNSVWLFSSRLENGCKLFFLFFCLVYISKVIFYYPSKVVSLIPLFNVSFLIT